MSLPARLAIASILAAALAGCGHAATGPAPHTPAATPASLPPDVAPASAVPFPSAPATPSASPFAPRPVELPLSGISNPCILLTLSQRAQLGLQAGTVGTESDGPTCSWSAPPPAGTWTASLDLYHGAEFALSPDNPFSSHATKTTIAGYGAVDSTTGIIDPAQTCELTIDVAPGRNLHVSYLTIEAGSRPLNHQISCQRAATLATAVLSTLRSHTS